MDVSPERLQAAGAGRVENNQVAGELSPQGRREGVYRKGQRRCHFDKGTLWLGNPRFDNR